ncbi:MAG: peptide ABC transporter substrate-binding protein, partial [Clostridia bacterium]|nr:peptide ABC transporter substrate-binding protein [Clostridia bacterium]
MSKKLLCLLLSLIMIVSVFAACGKTDNGDDKGNEGETATPVDPYAGKEHAEISEDLYNKVLGEFDTYYKAAKAATNVSERFALMAIAEAKLLSTGVMLPSTAQGGNYVISRIAPYSISSVLWGNDSDRFYTAVIVNEDPLTPALRDEMKAKWGEFETGAEYLAWAKTFLTEKGYTISDTYNLGYTSDPKTWDALATSKAADSEAIVNTYDGLLEYDAKNNQVPALAESYTVSEDGLVYSFKLREGIQWVDYQGKAIEEVTADSFVYGFRHMLDAAGGLEYLVQGVVKGASEYIAGEITDFAEVGV